MTLNGFHLFLFVFCIVCALYVGHYFGAKWTSAVKKIAPSVERAPYEPCVKLSDLSINLVVRMDIDQGKAISTMEYKFRAEDAHKSIMQAWLDENNLVVMPKSLTEGPKVAKPKV